MTTAAARSRTAFEVPQALDASEPPEASGRPRDDVRLLVARAGGFEHVPFRDLGEHLSAGDLLVVNTSATRPAAIDGIIPGGEGVTVHFSAAHPSRPAHWIVELREPDGSRRGGGPGDVVFLPGGGRVDLVEAHPDASAAQPRLWSARFTGATSVEKYLDGHGRPITYGYVRRRWPLDAYQTVFARVPGSAEMPSAARPFTHRLVTELVARGVVVAPIVLHCGVSSPELGEPPQEEVYEVPATTARLANEARRAGGRVIAVGTTAARALETTALRDGTVVASRGRTNLVLDEDRPARVVDGLVTGWHPPGASHLALLESVAGPELVQSAYDAALAHRYLWHEFGDGCLLLPGPRDGARTAAVA